MVIDWASPDPSGAGGITAGRLIFSTHEFVIGKVYLSSKGTKIVRVDQTTIELADGLVRFTMPEEPSTDLLLSSPRSLSSSRPKDGKRTLMALMQPSVADRMLEWLVNRKMDDGIPLNALDRPDGGRVIFSTKARQLCTPLPD